MINRPKIKVVDARKYPGCYDFDIVEVIGLAVIVPLTIGKNMHYFVCNPNSKSDPGLDAGILITMSAFHYFVTEEYDIYSVSWHYVTRQGNLPTYKLCGIDAIFSLPTKCSIFRKISKSCFSLLKKEISSYFYWNFHWNRRA